MTLTVTGIEVIEVTDPQDLCQLGRLPRYPVQPTGGVPPYPTLPTPMTLTPELGGVPWTTTGGPAKWEKKTHKKPLPYDPHYREKWGCGMTAALSPNFVAKVEEGTDGYAKA